MLIGKVDKSLELLSAQTFSIGGRIASGRVFENPENINNCATNSECEIYSS